MRAFNIAPAPRTTILPAVATSPQLEARVVTAAPQQLSSAAKLSRPERIAAKPHSHSGSVLTARSRK
jgi:hypothetical protein